MPASQSFRPLSGEGNELLGNLLGRVGSRGALHCLRHRGESGWVVEQRSDDLGRSVYLLFGNDDRSTCGLEVTSILRLMVAGSEKTRHEHGGLRCSRKLPDRAAGACKRQIARGERGAEFLREREQPVVGARYLLREPLVVARTGEMKYRRAGFAERIDRKIVQQRGAERAAEDEHHRSGLRQAEEAPRLVLREVRPGSRRNRTARHPVLRLAPARDREREEHTPRERDREPVRETEV